MSASFKFDGQKLLEALGGMETQAQASLRKYADSSAKKLESYAKRNARWKNHTGDARRRMKGDVLQVSGGYKLRLAHGVNYGIFLEMANERKFAIIEETIERVGSEEIMPGLKNLMERLGGA